MNTAAAPKAIKYTDAQLAAIHSLLTRGFLDANRSVRARLVAMGAITDKYDAASGHHKATITPAGKAAHDAIWTPERIAAERAAARKARAEAEAERDARHARQDARVEERNAAAVRLQELLGDDAPYWVKPDAHVTGDRSGIWGGASNSEITTTALLAIVEAALRNAGVQA